MIGEGKKEKEGEKKVVSHGKIKEEEKEGRNQHGKENRNINISTK